MGPEGIILVYPPITNMHLSQFWLKLYSTLTDVVLFKPFRCGALKSWKDLQVLEWSTLSTSRNDQL